MICHRRQIDPEVWPLRLQPSFHPGQYVGCATGRGSHQVMILSNSRRDTIIHYHAVLTQHQPVPAAPNFKR